jgi:hypothetical protein
MEPSALGDEPSLERKTKMAFPVWRDKGRRENFFALTHKAMLYSDWAAPYQDPTYRAIAVVSQATPSRAGSCLASRRHPGRPDGGERVPAHRLRKPGMKAESAPS